VSVPQDYAKALPHLRRALHSFQAASREDPADQRIQMEISMQDYLMAICLRDLRDLAGAEAQARRAVEIRSRLHAAGPQNVRVHEGLAAAHRLLRRTRGAAGGRI
jgi:hypothetical protein